MKSICSCSQKERSKHEDKAVSCIFLRHANEKFGYMSWDPKTNKVVRKQGCGISKKTKLFEVFRMLRKSSRWLVRCQTLAQFLLHHLMLKMGERQLKRWLMILMCQSMELVMSGSILLGVQIEPKVPQ